MEQYDQWQQFWDSFLHKQYGKETAENEDDLYLQVARTVNRKPVTREVFDAIIHCIITDLGLSPADVLVDLCCGNGLFTYELRDKVQQIIGVDFSRNIIDTANRLKAAPNITYCLGGVVDYLRDFKAHWPTVTPDKYLMNDSLAYFAPQDLDDMLQAMMALSPQFSYLTRGVPNDELKWKYYNTPERKQFYEGLLAKGDRTFAGLGSWWQPQDIRNICSKLGLQCAIRNQPAEVSDYRMDVLISR